MHKATLNARVAAIGLVVGAGALHALNQFDYRLVPARLVVLCLLVFAAWAFSDEMGLRRPLNRAALTVFGLAMAALAVTIVEPTTAASGTYPLIYAFALLVAMLVWSGALLHRAPELKAVGAVGALASAVPLLLIVAGHVAIGAGAWAGASGLTGLGAGNAALGTTPVNIVEGAFLVWCVAVAFLLWRGRMSTGSVVS